METEGSYHQAVNNGNGDSNHSWYILSLVSWIIFICVIWFYYQYQYTIWEIFEYQIEDASKISIYFPIRILNPWLKQYICLISLIGFVVYLVFTTCKKKQELYDGMMGAWGKFHFIPLLLISALFITVTTVKPSPYEESLEYNKMLLIFDIIFTLLALISLILIYIKMELNCEWYIVMTIKKGLFSSLIVILWYNLFHIIICLRSIDCLLGDCDKDSLTSFFKSTGLAFSIVIGIGSLVFSALFNDVAAAFTNFLIYLGFVIYFFYSNTETIKIKRKDEFNGVADGVIDIIIMCLSLILIAICVIRHNQILV